MSDARKLLLMMAAVVALCAVGIGYVLWAGQRASDDLAAREARALEAIGSHSPSETVELATSSEPKGTAVPSRLASVDDGVIAPGDILVVNRVPGDDYGRLTVVRPDGSRQLLDQRCERVHVGGSTGVCAAPLDTGFGGWETLIFDAASAGFPLLHDHSSALPSRARVSPDGSVVSTTAFLSGRSYEDIGGEATTIAVIVDVATSEISGLVQYASAERLQREDTSAQYWGVTFADPAGSSFYATALYNDGPVVISGDIDERTLSEPLFDGSCPSVSPDGTRMVYKSLRSDGGFDLVVRDLDSGNTRILDETRSVDDQVEWLDDETILYALHAAGEADEVVDPSFDIWKLDIAEGSVPELFIPAASSPAVVR